MLKGIGTVFLIIVAIAVAAEIKDDKKSDEPAAAASTPLAHIGLDRGRSFCREFPLEARIVVYVTLANRGRASGTVDSLVPVRRYSDGSTNDSILDAMIDLKVPGGGSRRFYALYDYEALDHDLIECSVRFSSTGNTFRIAVRSPG